MKMQLEYELSVETLRTFCIINGYFTRGTCEQYEQMFELVEKDSTKSAKEILEEISQMIYDYSDITSVAGDSCVDFKELIEQGNTEQFIDLIDEEIKEQLLSHVFYKLVAFIVSNNKFPEIM